MAGSRQQLRALIAALAISAPAVASAAVSLPAYFSPLMPPFNGGGGCPSLPAPATSAPARWWQQTTPPATTDTCRNFAFGPLTDASEQPVGAFSSSKWSGGLWPRIWGRRGPRPPALGFGDPPSNPIFPYINTPSCASPAGPLQPNMVLGNDYSSVAKANAVTEAETLHMLGASASAWQAPLIAQGFNLKSDTISYTALAADPNRFVDYKKRCNSHDGKSYVTVDKFILHDKPGWVYVSGQSTPPTGILIDWEVNDFRSPGQGAMFLVQLAKDIHNHPIGGVVPQVFLYTNPWEYLTLRDGIIGGMAANGFDFSHIDQVKGSFDFISFYPTINKNGGVCDVLPAFLTTITNLSGISGIIDTHKLVVIADMWRCNEQDMLNIFNLNTAQKFGGYAIFPKDTIMGGQQLPFNKANLLLWRLMYGTRAPPQ